MIVHEYLTEFMQRADVLPDGAIVLVWYPVISDVVAEYATLNGEQWQVESAVHETGAPIGTLVLVRVWGSEGLHVWLRSFLDPSQVVT